MRKVEIFLFAVFLISWIIKDIIGLIKYDGLVLTFGVLVALIYLFGNYWISRPLTKTLGTSLITVLYGVVSACLTFLLMFKMFFLTGTDELAVLTIISLTILVVIDLLVNGTKNLAITKWTTVRFFAISTIILTLYLIPESSRVKYTYRKYPEFIKYYSDNENSMEFYDIYEDYFRKDEE